jgi:RNA polymerase sigma-70 factor, ECF subfamily
MGARDGAHGGSVGDAGERFRRLYDEFVAPVYAFCGRRLGSLNGAAEDVTADIFTVVWRNIDKVPPAPECRTFIYGIAYRQVRKQQQKCWARSRLQRRLEAEWPLTSTAQPGRATLNVPRDRIHLAIEALPKGERDALLLVMWDGLNHVEAGRVLGCSANAVALRLYKARARIRRQLAGDPAGETEIPVLQLTADGSRDVVVDPGPSTEAVGF